MTTPSLERLRGGLVVSCQARQGEPLDAPDHIVALARSAVLGGAVGVRIDGSENISAVRRATDVPIIGIKKVADRERPRITPTEADVIEVLDAGADIVAVDASMQYRTDVAALHRIVRRIRAHGTATVMADISTRSEAERAWEAGVDVVGTTLYGHTPQTSATVGPGLELVAELVPLGMRVIVEGRVTEPAEVEAAFTLGAWSVVVGGAITSPIDLTRRFAAVTPRRSGDHEPAEAGRGTSGGPG
ncbi:N-acylglucosamine-6-phosphate 2-epimerase [Beutenbergia cavernae DSM 12333]|uniref:N-acylglucosamine-6-phosphate 2-epimerase n=1 Tax=Beutenbergia cavernae (strain ATCC BAA-8 / DSM 12333 / CCUG 43141 / JCM 11478 / NBRC 16432 / NCIMB 13614 / HKI 0122) TaxID=471853 RepID=C5BX25_BEUC1|nr:N-acetylmannosamine-6-phosphate 2-epimerase [Beutenbergia cavernae]ACQ78700.1 N-acylglucosamine-6-phosphate 2-epimerase [Beutenbergia cavernae DSM 12333]